MYKQGLKSESLVASIIKKLPQHEHELLPDTGKSVTFINPHSYILARNQDISLYASFNFICFDGVILPKLLNLFTGIVTPRISFDMTSLAPKIFEYASNCNKAIYFVGSTEENILNFKYIFSFRYPNVLIAGIRNGYFRSKSDTEEFYQEIKVIKPDIIIVGMGTPMQDYIIRDLKKILANSSIYSCGGFFHQSTKGLNYYPKFFNKFNLRWLYRILDEPKLIIRYFIRYPYALLVFLKDIFLFKLGANQSKN